MFRKILLVCVGNICRSPTAEIVMRHMINRDDVEIASAGLKALVDSPIDPTARQVLTERGLDGTSHRARQVNPLLLAESDLILAMQQKHLASIVTDVPQVSGKVFLLGKWRGGREIHDPHRQQRPAFEHVYEQIEDCVASWRRYIQ